MDGLVQIHFHPPVRNPHYYITHTTWMFPARPSEKDQKPESGEVRVSGPFVNKGLDRVLIQIQPLLRMRERERRRVKFWPLIEHCDNLGRLFLQVGLVRSLFSLPSASSGDMRVKFRDYRTKWSQFHLLIVPRNWV